MGASEDSESPSIEQARRRGFFTARWRGQVPLERLFWHDLILIGTTVNVAATLVSLGLLAAKVPLAVALAVHFAPLPYNLFLAFAVWRTAEARGGPMAFVYQMAALVWLVVAILI